MKAVIPVAGAGTRLRPLTYTQPKPLIPVAGKPILCFIIDQLREAGVTEYVFIIGYLGDKIRDYVEATYPDIDAVFVEQDERLGSAHAIYQAREHLRDTDELIIFFGDAILDMDTRKLVDSPTSIIGIKRVEDPRQFGVVEFDQEGNIRTLVEKPTIPKSNLAMVGVYKVREVPELLEAIEHNLANGIRSIGEFPLTDALSRMLERGIKFTTFKVDNWFDCGRREVLLETNATLLNRPGYATDDPPPYDNAIIIHPVSIGPRCRITNSIIGPHVTIGANAEINESIIQDSIIGDFTSIREIILRHSVVGNDALITGMRQSLSIGDNTEIDLSVK
ncbi:MAG: sugar phosphate nucleotidyltransferase [Saprospiraceae bacterium]